MNKNSKARSRQLRRFMKSNGGFPKPVYKKKAQPFPRPNKDEDVSLTEQKRIWDAANGILTE